MPVTNRVELRRLSLGVVLALALLPPIRTAARANAAQQATPAARGAGEGGRGGRGGGATPPGTAKEMAPVDFTGYWGALVTQDWRWRMLVPPKGEYNGIPLNADGRRVADTWDAAKDVAAGEQCRAFGAPNLMRLPGRLHITWQDDQTLKIDADAGTQTRLLRFMPAAEAGGDWQGVSVASWETMPARRGPAQLGRALKVVTTKLKPGYLRRNGVPYSANATMTEYFDRVEQPNGAPLLVIATTIEDPAYLTQPYMVATHFQQQRDASGWMPTPCAAQ
jgi:hypothetical protein